MSRVRIRPGLSTEEAGQAAAQAAEKLVLSAHSWTWSLMFVVSRTDALQLPCRLAAGDDACGGRRERRPADGIDHLSGPVAMVVPAPAPREAPMPTAPLRAPAQRPGPQPAKPSSGCSCGSESIRVRGSHPGLGQEGRAIREASQAVAASTCWREPSTQAAPCPPGCCRHHACPVPSRGLGTRSTAARNRAGSEMAQSDIRTVGMPWLAAVCRGERPAAWRLSGVAPRPLPEPAAG